MVEFELRDVQSSNDEAERDYHLAYRAVFHDRQPPTAVRLMNARLAIEPLDVVALTMRAHAFRAMPDCKAALADARAAEELLQSKEDDRATANRHEWHRELHAVIREIVTEGGCRGTTDR